MPNVVMHRLSWGREDALQLAHEVIEVARARGTIALHLDPVGTLHVQVGIVSVMEPFVLVGVYSAGATVERIASDILATQSECNARALK